MNVSNFKEYLAKKLIKSWGYFDIFLQDYFKYFCRFFIPQSEFHKENKFNILAVNVLQISRKQK